MGLVYARYCGSSIPAVITSMSNMLTVHFMSDGSLGYNGFSANYITKGE